MQGLLEFLKRLGPARLAAMGAVTVGLVAFFGFIILRMSQPTMTTLFTDMTMQDSAGIVRELERQGVPFELRRDGATILVPQDQVTRLRMRMAEQGLPKGGGVGYEIFDKSEALGATSFVQNINHLRALEGELARTIRAIDKVQSARVHLVMPERALFARDRQEPSASIVLKVRGQLEPQHVRAVRHLVASAVQGLKPERISIVDESGQLLASGTGDGAALAGAGLDERHVAMERRLREQVEQIVGSVVGPGRARVQITAEMDFNRVTQTSDTFDPEGRVVRSTQTREEQSQSNEAREGAVSVGNELPGAAANRPAGEQTPRDQARKSEEIVNYEISRTQRTEVIEAGRIKRLSVAVAVDGSYTRDAQGNVTWQARPQEEMQRIAALVRSTIGFDQRRGDQVEIVNLRFAETPPVPVAEPEGWMSMFRFTKDDVMRAIELGVMLILAILVLLLVVRPLVRKMLAPEAAPALAGPAGAGGAGSASLPGGTASAAGDIATGAGTLPVTDNPTIQLIEVAQFQGQVHQQSVDRIGELVEKNPHETTAIIRQWLQDAA